MKTIILTLLIALGCRAQIIPDQPVWYSDAPLALSGLSGKNYSVYAQLAEGMYASLTENGTLEISEGADLRELLRLTLTSWAEAEKRRMAESDRLYDRRQNYLSLLTAKPEMVKEDSNFAHQAALTRAMVAWRDALGQRLPFARPKLVYGKDGACGIEEDSIACALPDRNEIRIANIHESTTDLYSIMLHEVGHLLGVPHIEGDLVMSPSYSGVAEKPTEYAVAIARVVLARRRK